MLMPKIALSGLVAAVALAGVAADDGNFASAQTGNRLRALGLKVYWSLLDGTQKEEAREILSDHLADTAADRLRAASRLLRYKADVAEVLTKEQRLKLGRLLQVVSRLPEAKKRALLGRILERTDRELLAERLESLDGADAQARVETGILILDQLHGAVRSALVERVGLTDEQSRRIDVLYSDLKEDLKPLAVRLARARADVVEKGLAILSDEQRAKLATVKEAVLAKVLTFVRGK